MRNIRIFRYSCAFILLLSSCSSYALIGLNDYGYGARSKSMGGTAVADPEDALASAANPAGITELHTQAEFGLLVTSPRRGYEASNPGEFSPFAVAPGKYWSRKNYFFVPNMGFVSCLNQKWAYGIAMYGNGGLNTDYSPSTSQATIGASPGVYGGNATGIDLKQLFINLSLAWKANPNFSLGASLLPVLQLFQAKGLSPFAPFSIAPNELSNQNTQSSKGFGIRIGGLAKLSPNLRIGAAYQPKIPMSKFSRYAGLFPNRGSFDIPSTALVGLSYTPRSNLTLNMDIQKIWYSDIQALSNPNNCGPGAPCLGIHHGAGFGWNNPLALKLGVQWIFNELWTLRAGYAHLNQTIPSDQGFFNILAPVATTNQYTLGFTKKIYPCVDFNFGTMYAPLVKVAGENPFNPAQTIQIFLRHYEFFGSLTWHFA